MPHKPLMSDSVWAFRVSALACCGIYIETEDPESPTTSWDDGMYKSPGISEKHNECSTCTSMA